MNNTLLGLSPMNLTIGLAIFIGLVFLLMVGIGAFNPVLLRMGLRNTLRRPSQTILLLCGLVLSTVLFTASFGLEDSLTASGIAYRAARVGTVDEAVTGTFSPAQVQRYLTQIRQNKDVQAATGIAVVNRNATLSSARTSFYAPDRNLYALPPDFDQVYGSLTDINGHPLHVADLRPTEIYLTSSLAATLDVTVGDTLQLQITDATEHVHLTTVTIRAILSNTVAVTTSDILGNMSLDEIIMPLASYQRVVPGSLGAVNTICLKNAQHAGLTDAAISQSVVSFLERLFGVSTTTAAQRSFSGDMSFAPTQIHPVQPDLLALLADGAFNMSQSGGEQATIEGQLIPPITLLLVGAGMLLTSLLFILLATERRAELGISRAIGLGRRHVILSLLIEGIGYGLVASLLGLLAGIGAVALELIVLSHMPLTQGVHFPLLLRVSWQSLLIAFGLVRVMNSGLHYQKQQDVVSVAAEERLALWWAASFCVARSACCLAFFCPTRKDRWTSFQ